MASLIDFVTILSLVILLEAETTAAAGGKSMHVFGDSLFDAGNSQLYNPTTFSPSNHHPYGSAFTTASGRYSDGLLVPDFIAKYVNLPLLPPALDPDANGTFGYNFACAGSGVFYHANSMMLNEQLELYKNLTALNGESKNNSVHLLSTGGNDYIMYFISNSNATQEEMQDLVDSVIQGLKEAIQEIYRVGGRKFAFQDVGPLGCYPSSRYTEDLLEGCYEKMNTIARLHNVALRSTLKNMTDSEEYKDIKYGVFDYYNQLSLRFNNPTNYGFKESGSACCGYGSNAQGGQVNGGNCGRTLYFLCSNPSSFVFFDDAHTTQALNSQLAELMWTGDQTVIAPYNVQQLFEMDEDDNNLRPFV